MINSKNRFGKEVGRLRVFENLEPKDVFYFFEEICRIPHGSGNIREISNYLVDFAKARNLEYYQDEIGNVIIIKEAFAGYETHKPVMLQGHMDMVAVKKPDCDIDMEKEGLRLRAEGDRVYAEGTSLGGDDGIAVAYGLALLDGNDYPHPRIEMVITVDEETGMDGARAIDLRPCRANQLINLDSEEEGIFLTGCAGGARVNYEMKYEQAERKGIVCEIEISGLAGGHSGAEIHKERGNANCLLGRALYRLSKKTIFGIAFMEGGLADNAIPRTACAKIIITGYINQNGWQKRGEEDFSKEECRLVLKTAIEKLNKELKLELAEKDREVSVQIRFLQDKAMLCMEEDASLKMAAFLNSIPDGVQSMSGAMPGLVETSLNLGILTCREGQFHGGISVRSSLESGKAALINRLRSIGLLAGADVSVTGDYPGWTYRKNSPLREKMIKVYEEMFQKKPKVEAIHAGLECGILAGKIKDLDCVSIGPDMKNIHTTEEELSISSTERVWKYLRKLLSEM